jgi:hypothetical protein
VDVRFPFPYCCDCDVRVVGGLDGLLDALFLIRFPAFFDLEFSMFLDVDGVVVSELVLA